MKIRYSFFFFVAALMCACSVGTPTTLTNDEAQMDTIPVSTVVVELEEASADMATFGSIESGRVKSILTDDMLAETPEIRFDEQGRLVASKPAEVIIRDKQGRTANHNGGKMEKDTTGYLFRTVYTYVGESYQVKTIYTENTVNRSQSFTYRRFAYTEDHVYPAVMFELLQSGQWPAANYSTYAYKEFDENGNWLSREVTNYYFERPDFLSPEVMSQLQNEEAMLTAEQHLRDHLEEATPTTYIETRSIEYYQ